VPDGKDGLQGGGGKKHSRGAAAPSGVARGASGAQDLGAYQHTFCSCLKTL